MGPAKRAVVHLLDFNRFACWKYWKHRTYFANIAESNFDVDTCISKASIFWNIDFKMFHSSVSIASKIDASSAASSKIFVKC